MNSAQKREKLGGKNILYYCAMMQMFAEMSLMIADKGRRTIQNLMFGFIFLRSQFPLCNDGFIYNDIYIILLSKKYIQRISDFLFCILTNPEEVWQPHNMTKINHEKKLMQDTYKTFKDLNTVRVIYLLLDEREGKERGKNVVLNTRSSPWNKMNKS